ncbi:MAG TPA: cupin domain-containing protein [Candidatus Eremiobacteraceae bacterium]|nr:cupin domain-containing protein [Candidatus Eremiobacteraceae bacterium]
MRLSAVGLAAAALLTLSGAVPAGAAMKPIIVTPAAVNWMPGTGQMAGLKVATLEGDPSKAGPWVIRLAIPSGTKFPVHYHPDTERVTVISGVFQAGVGKTFDASKLVTLPAGSYCVLPAGIRHYAMAKTATVIQLSGNQPFAMMMDKPM